MENTFDEINKLISEFETINFMFQKNDNSTVEAYFSKNISFDFYTITQRFKTKIRELHFSGNYDSILRIATEIDKLVNQDWCKDRNRGLRVALDGENKYAVIEPEQVNEFFKMQLGCLMEIKEYCQELLSGETRRESRDKLTHKQQILLLNQLGFFKSDFFNHLNETQKGVLVAHIVNRDEKNTEDNVRYVRGKRNNEDTKKIFTDTNIKAVNELLENIGLKQYKI